VHHNHSRHTATVSVTWWLEGQSLRDCAVAGGYYMAPITVQINQRQRIINAVLECSVKGRCTIKGSGGLLDGTLITDPMYVTEQIYVEDRNWNE
jgi:hypothetical protein